jgi:hypothetical protein
MFGTAGLVALAGVLCGTLVSGEAGQLLAISLLSIGLGAIVLLVFFEIGLSEDRDRAREQSRRERDARRAAARPRRPFSRLPRRRGD